MDIVFLGKICIGLFLLSVVILGAFIYARVIPAHNAWISLLIAIPVTLVLNELYVGNALWRNGKFLPFAMFTVLFAPLKVFGITGESRIPLWTPQFWPTNVFVLWLFTFGLLTFSRKYI